MRLPGRLLPDGLAARMMVLLAGALALALVAALAILAVQREAGGRDARLEGQLARLAALVPVVEAAAPSERRDVLRRGEGRGGRLALMAAPPPQEQDRRARQVKARLADLLPSRDVRVGDLDRGRLSVAVAIAGRPPWLVARLVDAPPRIDLSDVLPWLLLVLFGLVLGAGLLVARQIARPLGALEAAAQAAGRGDRSARAPESGPREMRRAAAAFNDMQSRIARAEAERARVMGALGHDLRTPITGLRIRAEMLPEEEGNPIIEALDEMAVMADGLLAQARGEAEPEEPQEVDLAAFLRALAQARGAEVGPLDAVRASISPVALRRAVGNLIDNALRYAGRARLSLTRDGAEAVIAVEDDGPGIPEERLADVMEPFVRGDTARGTPGAGLGLSIAATITRAHGGELTLRNRPNGGLRTEIRLPVKR